MFKCLIRGTYEVVTVYAVDCDRDAFLIEYNGKFKWRSMDEFEPFEELAGDMNG